MVNKLRRGFLCVLGVGVLLFMGLAFALHIITPSEVNVNEDVTKLYNITINNSDAISGVAGNITQVNVTLPSGFTFLADSNRSTTLENATFVNTSSVLSWSNWTYYLVNGSEVHNFLFNATAANPGNFNITVTTYNSTSTIYTNVSVIVNDTTPPATVIYVNPTTNATNISNSFILVNVTTSDNGILGGIIVEIFNSTIDRINSSVNNTSPFTPHYVNFSGLADGTYRINVTTNDTYGNRNSTATRIITVDTVPPIVYKGNITSIGDSRNYSGSLLLNVSVADVTAGVGTVIFNITNSTGFQNATYTTVRDGTTSFYNVTINTVNFPDGVYNVSVIANDSTSGGNRNNSASVVGMIFDNTPPIVYSGNISNPLQSTNYSANFTFNVSVVDVTSTVRAVIINITNSTGFQNATYTATREGTSNRFSVSVDSTNFPEGTYNLTVIANDSTSGGNRNNSASINNMIFDRTPPIVYSGNVTSIADSRNYSGSLLLNVSVVDVTTAVRAVIFNITNITGFQNATYTTVRDGTTSFYNVTINTVNFPDGVYNVSVIANDSTSGGNRNNSAKVADLRFDNTPPIVYNGNISSPVNSGNHSANFTFNVSVVDVTSTVRAVIINITNSTGFQNATYTATREGTSNRFSVSVDSTNFPEGTYNLTVIANDSTSGGNRNNSASINNMIFDRTPPIVFNNNISTPITSGNYTGSVVLNVSVVDVTAGMGAVTFNITNVTGVQNATYVATREGTTDRFSVSVNTASFPDGDYNITVIANDSTTGGNRNNSAKVANINFDNTGPVISFSCTPTTVTTGDVVTCSCTATDALSGVNLTTYTTSPSTANTGLFSTQCSSMDRAGNSNTASISYRVVGTTGSSGGSGGGGSTASEWTTTISRDSSELSSETPVVQQLKAKERVSVKVGGATHNVGVKSLTANSATIEVASNPQSATLQIGESKKFELTNDTSYDVSVTLNGILNNKANLTIIAIQENIPVEEAVAVQQGTGNESSQTVPEPEEEKENKTVYWIIGIVIVIIVIWLIVKASSGKKENSVKKKR